jgi:hypothetical protein
MKEGKWETPEANENNLNNPEAVEANQTEQETNPVEADSSRSEEINNLNNPEAKVSNNPAEDNIQTQEMREKETKKAREALSKFPAYRPVDIGVQAAKDFIENRYELTQRNISNAVRAIGSGLAILHDINPELIIGEKWIKRYKAAKGMMEVAKAKLLQEHAEEVQIALAETKESLYNRENGEGLFFGFPSFAREAGYKEALRTLEEFQATDLIKQLINELQEGIASRKIRQVVYKIDTRWIYDKYTPLPEDRPQIAQHQIEVLQNLLKKIEERQQGQVKKTV